MGQKVVQKIGKYEIISELGQGGMGVVYKARDTFMKRLVALKTVNQDLVSDPEILKRFNREATSAGRLQHPNIVTVFDLGEHEGAPYIAMEFLEGESLQSMIERQAAIPLAAKLKLTEQVCLGLDHAHRNGIVHRDVKPGNILVTNDGTAKVVDFGIVHLESNSMTKTGMFMGTIQYASPEQLNEGRVDKRSDLWSVTCVIYELISYRKPFEGSNFGAILGKILNHEPEPLSKLCPGIPEALDAIIAKGLKKNINERYQSLEELMQDLAPIARSLQRTLVVDLLKEVKELKEKGELIAAQEKIRAVFLLDRANADAKLLSSSIIAELNRLASQPRVKELRTEGEEAFKRREFAEAIRALSEVLTLNPNDTQARNLRDRAEREQDRLRQVKEALSAGQRAMKQGDLTGAEVELNRVIELDQNNDQASKLLKEIRQDRASREKNFGMKEALWTVDNMVAAGKYAEAEADLAKVKKEFPDASVVQEKLQQVRSLAANPPTAVAFPGSGTEIEKANWRETQVAEATKAMNLNDLARATMLLGSVRNQYPADQQVNALLQQAEQKKSSATSSLDPPVAAGPASAPSVATGPASSRPMSSPEGQQRKSSMGLIGGIIGLAAVLGVGGVFLHQRSQPAGTGATSPTATPQQIQLEHDAKLLQDYGNRDAALAKWQSLAAAPGPLQDEANQAISRITQQQQVESQEKTLFGQGVAAQQAKKWDDAIALYTKVANLNGPMKEQAGQAIASTKELQSGANIQTLEKEKYDRAVAAFNQGDYAQSRILFQQVVDLNAPGSTLAARAQAQIKDAAAAIQAKQQFAAADAAQTSGDLNGALAHFQDLAAKPGPFQAQAQSRVQQISQTLTANQQKQQAEKALQDAQKKLHDLEAQKHYGDAMALLGTIGQNGGDANQAKTDLESAEAADLTNLTGKFNLAKTNKDVNALQQLKPQFQNIESGSGAPATQAHDYSENQIPALIAQINLANQPKPTPPPAPTPAPARAPVVTLIVSGTYRPWTRSVQKGMLVPEYNVQDGLKPIDLSMAPVQGAESGSFATVKINIDELGNVTPDIVLLDPSGVGPAIMAAAKKWKFNPPMVKGLPVKTSLTVKISF